MFATIGKIIDVHPIPGADRIVQAEVICGKAGKWRGVVGKEMGAGQLVEVYLQDAVVPQEPRFDFMAARHHVVRMARFKGVASECLIVPLTVHGEVGDDIAEKVGATKFEKPVPASVAGDIYAAFPSFIPKTDEPNFQAVPELVDGLVGKPYYITEKADGSSATVYRMGEHFGCCSRNWELKETKGNAIWKIAREYELERRLPDGYALQFEVVGPGIQKNRMGLEKIEPRLFSVYKIFDREYCGLDTLMHVAHDLELPMVNMLRRGQCWSLIDPESIQALAVGNYPNGHVREGVVVRSTNRWFNGGLYGGIISFKVLNLDYKD